MPCTDGGYSEIAAERELRKLEKELDERNAMLCGVLTYLEKHQPQVMKGMISEFDSEASGVPISKLEKWWRDHKEQDKRRIEASKKVVEASIVGAMTHQKTVVLRMGMLRRLNKVERIDGGITVPVSRALIATFEIEKGGKFQCFDAVLSVGKDNELEWAKMDSKGKWMCSAFLFPAKVFKKLPDFYDALIPEGFPKKTAGIPAPSWENCRTLGVKFTTEMNFDLDKLKWNLTKLRDDSESDEDEE